MTDWLPVKFDFKVDVKPSSETIDKIVEALLTIISPATETAGLIGDIFKYRRKVLSREFELALERIQHEKKTFQMPPPKFMLEFADKASREELESEFIELWANLLHEASTKYSSDLIPYINVLSQLGSREVKILNSMVLQRNKDINKYNKRDEDKKLPVKLAKILVSDWDDFPWKLVEEKKFEKAKIDEKTVNKFLSRFKDNLKKNIKSHGVYSVSCEFSGGFVITTFPADEPNRTSFEILEFLRLVSFRKEKSSVNPNDGKITIVSVGPTLFGVKLALIGLGSN